MGSDSHDGMGIGEFTEGGLENSNKFLRFYRRNLARNVSQSANLEDFFSRLWLRSDPLVRAAALKPTCSRCSEVGHFTVSCPQKARPVCLSAQSLDDYFLSVILKE